MGCFLAVVVVLFGLAGCGGSAGEGQNEGDRKAKRATGSRPTVEAGGEMYHSSGRSASGGAADGQSRMPQLPPKARRAFEEIRGTRDRRDRTVWKKEVLAQRYWRRSFVELWNRLKDSEEKLRVLAEMAEFGELTVGEPGETEAYDHGVKRVRYRDPREAEQPERYDAEAFARAALRLREAGYRLEMSEWHHPRFQTEPDRSTVSFRLYVRHPERKQRFFVEGKLRVRWSTGPAHDPRRADTKPRIERAWVTDLELLKRTGPAWFREADIDRNDAGLSPDGEESAALWADSVGGAVQPFLLYDLNRNGHSEIILPDANALYWNGGRGRFQRAKLVKYHPDSMHLVGAVIADFTGDGLADLVCATDGQKGGRLLLYEGNKHGRFPEVPTTISGPEHRFEYVRVITAGDIDGDDDLDLWVGQYRPPYRGRPMFPEPYYDANSGPPAYLFRNDGDGRFTEITERAGLGEKRRRRTFSSSFVDLDADGDQDLVVVSDFAGVDLYYNDGSGHFEDVTDMLGDARHMFGMSHMIDDFNRDGRLDFYAIGMSSPTARRLERMARGPEGYPERNRMRSIMGYGNRMFLGTEGGEFRVAEFSDSVARTSWTWGSAAFDFDNDGDRDITVANGHISGESTREFATMFWRHDIYTTNDAPQPALLKLYSAQPYRDAALKGEISYNGYDKNALFMNQAGEDFMNVAYLFGAAFGYDARGLVTGDLDGDGRVDLLVEEYTLQGDALHVYRNTASIENHWIGVRLYEHGDGFTPVGARVTVRAGEQTQVDWVVTGDSYSAEFANMVHFGLGDVSEVQAIEVRWPNGETSRLTDPEVDRYHRVDPPSVKVD